MLDKLSAMEQRYRVIGEELTQPSVLGDYTKLQELGRERAGLEKVVCRPGIGKYCGSRKTRALFSPRRRTPRCASWRRRT